ncbi:MAG: amino acid adenylation domain-containing protein [Acidimicrobiales bacterium]
MAELVDPEQALLHRFLDAPTRRHPHQCAIDVPPAPGRERRTLTYAALRERSCALAGVLAVHVRPDAVVAILLPRDVELFVAQLAVLHAGAAFVCLDPSFPDDHIRFVLEDAGATAMVTNPEGVARTARIDVGALRVIDVLHEDLGNGAVPAVADPRPEHLAYLIYTSGTTGRPKGVMVEHRNVANLVRSNLVTFGLGPADRCAQSSSAAYDSSIDESWLALACGATLVVADDRTVRSGPDLVDWLRKERITVFCPPPTLLRTTGCRDPQTALPHLRLLYVGGEALPDDIVERWSHPWRLENGYGPTECAIVATRATVRRNEEVTIGLPIAGNEVHVLDDALEPVSDGEVGELCIAGTGVARGYANLPALTAERFPVHPVFGRMYRTGDLVRRRADGALVYIGRLDLQVKVRGHRIELQAVEAVLASCAGVREAVCTVQGSRLVGFVVPDVVGAAPDPGALRDQLARLLPPAMVPSRLGVLDGLPTTVGGKLDRQRLPVFDDRGAGPLGDDANDLDDIEVLLTNGLSAALGAHVDIDDDLFDDLGADSLAIAEAVSRFREDARTRMLTVRDVIEARNVRGLRALCRTPDNRVDRPASVTLDDSPAIVVSPLPMILAQCAWILGELAVIGLVARAMVFGVVPHLVSGTGAVGAIALMALSGIAAALLWFPLALAITVVLKTALLGRGVGTTMPYWSSGHLRVWMVTRAARRIPWRWTAGTPLAAFALRRLGAQVGRGVHIARGVDFSQGGWDLLHLGDGAVLARDAAVRPLERGRDGLATGRIYIGAGAVVGVRAYVGPGCVLGEDAILTDLSALDRGAEVGAGERFDGVPARLAGATTRRDDTTPVRSGEALRASRAVAFGIGVRAMVEVPAVAVAVAIAWMSGTSRAEVAAWLVEPHAGAAVIAGTVGFAVLHTPCTLLAEALVVRAVAPRVCGRVALDSFAWERVRVTTQLVDAASRWLSGTLLWTRWLRLAGMSVGADSEISTVIDVVPSLVAVGAGSFLADGIYLGPPPVRHGHATLERTILGRDTFVGNHAVITAGASLPDDVLIGVSTVTGSHQIDGPGTWFGRPPLRMPRPGTYGFDRSLTHEPSVVRRVNRWFWELLRVTVPAVAVLLGFLWLALVQGGGIVAVIAATPIVGVAAVATVLAAKWVLLGRVRPGKHALWSCWASRWDFLYVLWAWIARPQLMQLEGTLLLNGVLRCFGMDIGRRVVLGPQFAQVVDPDMLHFGDGAVVEADFQAHTFEERVLRIGHVHVRPGAHVATHAVLFYGSDVGERATLRPGSVALKGERLLAAGDYSGVPVSEHADEVSQSP